MLARNGRLSTDMFSPCSGVDRRKWLDRRRRHDDPHLLHRHPNHAISPEGWPATAAMESEEDCDDNESRVTGGGGSCFSRTTGGDSNSELMMLMTETLGGREEEFSSYGSCGGWSISLTEKRPATPSPICSSYDLQSSISITEDKKSASPEEVAGEKRREETNRGNWETPRDVPHQLKRQSVDSSFPRTHALCDKPRTKGKTAAGSSSSQQQYFSTFSCNPTGSFRSCDGECDDRRLPSLTEEEQEEEERGGCREEADHHLLESPHILHPGGASQLRSDDGYYREEESDGGSRCENSDIDSAIEEDLGSSAAAAEEAAREREEFGGRFSASTSDRGAFYYENINVQSKLVKWKEGRTLKLMDKLGKKEAGITEWERQQTTKAKMVMKEFEMKLEKQRERALLKMQRRILTAQRKAEKKKLKERTSAVKKMSEVTEAFQEMGSTGKIPRKLICCF